MVVLSPGALIRHDHWILKLPPYLSFLCVVVGLVWLLLLPLNEYSRRTYISENALLPGQVHTYFAGSDQNVFQGYKQEVHALEGKSNAEINDKIEDFFRASGLKVARQRYQYRSGGTFYAGENTYAILHAPRGDATEAIVLMGPWRSVNGELNHSGAALVLTLARYFKRWSLWSKDIIFVITADSNAGPRAWVDAYHDTHKSPDVDPLPLKSGALQGAIVIDYPFDHRFESIHILYDGVNGQLPNLDLLNTVVSIASGQMGIGVALQQMWKHTDTYRDRLQTMLRGMLNQALGHGTGPHSSFVPYHVDAITLQPFGDGWQDEMAMGRVIESTFRSLNNLLEHLHQSFFFYLLMQPGRFVSIGTYLPSAMLLAINFTIMSISLWVKSGWPEERSVTLASTTSTKKGGQPLIMVKHQRAQALIPKKFSETAERKLFLPLVVVASFQTLGVVPLYLFNHVSVEMLVPTFIMFSSLASILPVMISRMVVRYFEPTMQHYQLIKSFSLLLLGMFLSSLATLNFSLAFLIGLIAAPLTYVRPLPGKPVGMVLQGLLINLIAPPFIIISASHIWHLNLGKTLVEAEFGWDVSGMTTQIVVWCVWWPSWLVGLFLLFGRPIDATNM